MIPSGFLALGFWHLGPACVLLAPRSGSSSWIRAPLGMSPQPVQLQLPAPDPRTGVFRLHLPLVPGSPWPVAQAGHHLPPALLLPSISRSTCPCSPDTSRDCTSLLGFAARAGKGREKPRVLPSPRLQETLSPSGRVQGFGLRCRSQPPHVGHGAMV